jgi:hypothetical protein
MLLPFSVMTHKKSLAYVGKAGGVFGVQNSLPQSKIFCMRYFIVGQQNFYPSIFQILHFFDLVQL